MRARRRLATVVNRFIQLTSLENPMGAAVKIDSGTDSGPYREKAADCRDQFCTEVGFLDEITAEEAGDQCGL